MKNNQATTSRNREKYTVTVSGNFFYFVNLARAQDRGLRFWQTRSKAVIIFNSVPAGIIQGVVEKWRKDSYTKSIREDLRKPENSLIFSEDSSRIIQEMGNIELYELGQVSRTILCHSCFKHMPEGLAFCSYGMCLRLDEATIRRNHARFQTFDSTLLYARMNQSRGKKCSDTQWQQDRWKAVNANRGAKRHDKATITIRWQQHDSTERRS